MVKMVKEAGQICTLNKPPYCPKDGEHLNRDKSRSDKFYNRIIRLMGNL